MWSGVRAKFAPFEVSDLYHCVEPPELHQGLGEMPPARHTLFAPGKMGHANDVNVGSRGTLRVPTMSSLEPHPRSAMKFWRMQLPYLERDFPPTLGSATGG